MQVPALFLGKLGPLWPREEGELAQVPALFLRTLRPLWPQEEEDLVQLPAAAMGEWVQLI